MASCDALTLTLYPIIPTLYRTINYIHCIIHCKVKTRRFDSRYESVLIDLIKNML